MLSSPSATATPTNSPCRHLNPTALWATSHQYRRPQAACFASARSAILRGPLICIYANCSLTPKAIATCSLVFPSNAARFAAAWGINSSPDMNVACFSFAGSNRRHPSHQQEPATGTWLHVVQRTHRRDRTRDRHAPETEREHARYVQGVTAPSVITLNGLAVAEAVNHFMLAVTALHTNDSSRAEIQHRPRSHDRDLLESSPNRTPPVPHVPSLVPRVRHRACLNLTHQKVEAPQGPRVATGS
jgi:hypothetical protein